MSAGLGAAATRGALVTVSGQGLRIVVQLAGIVVLARLLEPSAYGLLAMVVAIIGVGDILRDLGLSSAAVQAKTVLPAQRTNLFWINLGIGAVLAAIAFVASWPISALYGDDRLQPLTALLSVTFLLNGAATQFRADLMRRLRFGVLAVTDTTGQLAGLLLAIWAAVAGWGYWALAVQQVVPVVVQLVLVVAMSRWVPGLPRRGVPMREFLVFGANLSATQVLTYASRNVDSIVLGATVGAGALGVYNRAFQLMTLPLNQLQAPATRVALPVLSKLQDDPARFAAFLGAGQTVLLNGVAAIIAFTAAQAPAIILLALGAQWSAAAPIYQVLAFAGFFTAAGYATWWVFLAKGLTGASLRIAVITRPLLIVAVLVGSLWGVFGVAIAYAVGCALLWPANLLWLRGRTEVPVGTILANGCRTLAVFAVAGAACFASTLAVPAEQPLLHLLIGAGAFIAALGLTAAVIPAYRRDLVRITSLRRHLRRRRARGTVPLQRQVA